MSLGTILIIAVVSFVALVVLSVAVGFVGAWLMVAISKRLEGPGE